jgi:5S rRNA maturation endonuclease (ribonuclease M5)
MYDRDALIAAVDLPALADELLGGHRGTARSPAWPCPNPQHAQTGRTPPVAIFTSRRGEQRWRCHGCGTGGTAIDLVMACCETSPRDAIDRLARRAGLSEQDPPWSPRRRPLQQAEAVPRGCSDPAAMDRYVEQCAAALFEPAGRRIRRWLNNARGLPDDILAANRIGADLGPRHQQRPDGMPRAFGVVLPVIVDGHAVYAQIRVTHPRPDGPRYLNPTGALAANPRLAHFRPTEERQREVIVTEGAIDALSVTSAGYRSVAILSAAYPDQAIAHQLSRLSRPLVIAFDADPAGRAAAERLTGLLDAHQRHPVNLTLPAADLNDALVQSSNWADELEHRVRACVASQSDAIGRSLG